MELLKILYQPYVICIYIAIIITIITYFIISKDNKNSKEKDTKDKNKNNTKILLYTFIGSFLIAMILKYILDYVNSQHFFQKDVKDISSNLTIVADDVEIGLL